MRAKSLHQILRRAVLLALPLGTSPLAMLAACGNHGSTFADDVDASPTPERADATCKLASATPLDAGPVFCANSFPIVGSPYTCGAGVGQHLPEDACANLCPLGPVDPQYFDGATWPARACTVIGSTLYCDYSPCGTGRRPEGLHAATKPASGTRVGLLLAQMAHLERASVAAFEVLSRELEAHDAPRGLRARAKRAARDEVRHARVLGALARREEARVPRVRIRPRGPRDLEAVAMENAVEGCVRETFGAAVAMLQAKNAVDDEVRAAMLRIAEDEARHAELSWDVAAWLELHLDAAARKRVADAKRGAVADLARDIALAPPPCVAQSLGLPTVPQAAQIFEELRQQLWS
jgi:hypothetical protein